MKNIRFYLEYDNPKDKTKDTRKSLKHHSGNCIAVLIDDNGKFLYCGNNFNNVDCIAAIMTCKNSPVGSSSCGVEYLRKNCKFISEKQARKIHPELFNYLD